MRSIIFALAALVVAAGAAKAEVQPGSLIGTTLCTMPGGAWKLYDYVPAPAPSGKSSSKDRALRSIDNGILRDGLYQLRGGGSTAARRLGGFGGIKACVKIGSEETESGWPKITYTRTGSPPGYDEEFSQRVSAMKARVEQRKRDEQIKDLLLVGIICGGIGGVYWLAWYTRKATLKAARATVRTGLEAPRKTRSAVDRFAYKEED